MRYLKRFNEHYEYENFTMNDIEMVRELYEDGMTDPKEIAREMDLDVNTIIQILSTIKKSKLNESKISLYNKDWEKLLPNEITIIKGYTDGVKEHTYKKGNIMLNSDTVQITYENNEIGFPNTLEFDLYFVNVNSTGNIRLNVDITYGDEVVCEFSIEGNKLKLVQYTSFGSKFDPSNTVFGFDEKSLEALIVYFNRFNGMNISRSQFNFLDGIEDSYQHDYNPDTNTENTNHIVNK